MKLLNELQNVCLKINDLIVARYASKVVLFQVYLNGVFMSFELSENIPTTSLYIQDVSRL
jgi:hypothetical protein